MFGEVTYKLQLFVSDVDRIIQTILITAEKYKFNEFPHKNVELLNFRMNPTHISHSFQLSNVSVKDSDFPLDHNN